VVVVGQVVVACRWAGSVRRRRAGKSCRKNQKVNEGRRPRPEWGAPVSCLPYIVMKAGAQRQKQVSCSPAGVSMLLSAVRRRPPRVGSGRGGGSVGR